MKKHSALLLLFTSVISLQAQQVYLSDKLQKKWEIQGDLKVPESVLYDDLNQVIYVSNINGSPAEKDVNGFLSKISPQGKIISLHWVKGLNAPKGMGIIGNLLYVSDIDRVAEIDIQAGEILRFIEIPEAQFLNDITIDAQGNVYVSDSQSKTIYIIRQGNPELLIRSDELDGVNGLLYHDDMLLAGTKDKIVSINPVNKSVRNFINDTGGIDGLVYDGENNFIISDWTGHIYLVARNKAKIKLADTTPVNVNAADIEYAVSIHTLFVPTFSDNKVVAYELK